MAQCKCSKVTVTCDCGCGCICLSDPPHDCWVICESCPSGSGNLLPGLSASIEPANSDAILSPDARINFHCQEVTLGTLALAFDKIVEHDVCIPVGRLRHCITTSFEGSVRELMRLLNFTESVTSNGSRKKKK